LTVCPAIISEGFLCTTLVSRASSPVHYICSTVTSNSLASTKRIFTSPWDPAAGATWYDAWMRNAVWEALQFECGLQNNSKSHSGNSYTLRLVN